MVRISSMIFALAPSSGYVLKLSMHADDEVPLMSPDHEIVTPSPGKEEPLVRTDDETDSVRGE